jgi:hypothetical protein
MSLIPRLTPHKMEFRRLAGCAVSCAPPRAVPPSGASLHDRDLQVDRERRRSGHLNPAASHPTSRRMVDVRPPRRSCYAGPQGIARPLGPCKGRANRAAWHRMFSEIVARIPAIPQEARILCRPGVPSREHVARCRTQNTLLQVPAGNARSTILDVL